MTRILYSYLFSFSSYLVKAYLRWVKIYNKEWNFHFINKQNKVHSEFHNVTGAVCGGSTISSVLCTKFIIVNLQDLLGVSYQKLIICNSYSLNSFLWLYMPLYAVMIKAFFAKLKSFFRNIWNFKLLVYCCPAEL